MEELNLYHLSLLIHEDVVIIKDDIRKHHLSEKLKAKYGQFSEEKGEASGIPKGCTVREHDEEYQEERLKINYEGNFEKGILIIYQEDQLPSGVREFLMRILGAVDCSLKDVALVSANHLQELHEQSISQLNPRKCLLFGTANHPIMKLKHENYEIMGGETVYLFADDLKEIAENTPLKKKLWACLQVLFNINK
jgi:hypothetical protein